MEFLPHILAMLGIWAVVVMTPGPNFLAVTHHALAHSRKSGVICALGVAAGTSVLNAESVAAALVERGRTGRGVFIDVSMLETGLSLMSSTVTDYLSVGFVAKLPKPFSVAELEEVCRLVR